MEIVVHLPAEALKAGPIANRPGLRFDSTSHRWVREGEAAPLRLYHVTTRDNAAAIMANGFKPGNAADMGSGVYLTHNPNLVPTAIKDQDLAVVEVHAPGGLLRKDSAISSGHHELLGREEGDKARAEDRAAGSLRVPAGGYERGWTPTRWEWDRFTKRRILQSGLDGAVDPARDHNVVIYDHTKVKPIRVLPHGEQFNHPAGDRPAGVSALDRPSGRGRKD